LLPLLTLLVCHRLILPVFGLHFFGSNNMDATLDGLKIMTWNVHGLGLYERPPDKLRPEKMFELVDEQDPDVLCMIEYYTQSDGSNTKASRFFRDAGYREYRFSYDNTLGTKVYIGNAIFSKYPLSNFEEIQLDDHIKMMRCDVTMPGEGKVRLFAMHLQSFLLDDGDKVFIEEVKANTNKLDQKPGYSRTFFNKLQQAYKKRAPQADKARDEIAGSPYPVVLCADFNDVPMSYTYTAVKGNLKDAFAMKGKGLGRTYNLISPTLRIDYIFYDSKALDLIGYESIPTTLSDHNPVVANFRSMIPK
jgi:endonuclease/exonuclease/phosphatase family metal-dependent hydrolase